MERLPKPIPPGKHRELEFVAEVLREGFQDAIKNRMAGRFRKGRILKIILFGSYAKGTWVDDPIGRYFSDFDILVVVDHDDLTDFDEFWSKTDKRLLDELSAGQRLRTPVGLIVHSLKDINEQLERGRYFFLDIVREGIVLFEEPGHPFVEPKELAPQEALAEARGYYEEGIESADEFVRGANFFMEDGTPKKAAFMLHQATETLYHALFLTLTLYTQKLHNLNRLRSKAESLEPSLQEVWSSSAKEHRRAYELLREAYVKARYSRHYRITEDELAYLVERIEVLRTLVKQACECRLAEMEHRASQ